MPILTHTNVFINAETTIGLQIIKLKNVFLSALQLGNFGESVSITLASNSAQMVTSLMCYGIVNAIKNAQRQGSQTNGRQHALYIAAKFVNFIMKILPQQQVFALRYVQVTAMDTTQTKLVNTRL